MINPVAEAVINFWNFHPIWTIILGLAFFPELEVILGLLFILAALAS